MSHPQAPRCVVAGVDGSQAAINAARWAVPEAASRGIPLRLVHAVPERAASTNDEAALDVEYAQAALHAASAALHAIEVPVEVEVDIVRGSAEAALVSESLTAAMVCVGSVGIGRVARKLLGSTAEAVTQRAHCPAAIIRTNPDTELSDTSWIAVVVDDSPGNDAVLEHGFREAQLRGAPILAMGVWRWGLGEIAYEQLHRRLDRWVSRYRDVHVQPAAARHGAADFLAKTEEPIQLAVVGSDDAGDVARMVGAVSRRLPQRSGHSVLVVRR